MTDKRRKQAKAAPTLATRTAAMVRQRRKHARPAEIIDAALQVFAAQGFGVARMEDIARLAGVSKATLFVYFPNKEALFRAAARQVLSNDLNQLQSLTANKNMLLKEVLPLLLTQIASVGENGLPPIARLILTESRTFPDLARMWHEEVVSKVLGMLMRIIKRAQKRGQMPAGDPKLYVFSIIGPMLSALLFRDVFKGIDSSPPDLRKLAIQHAKLVTGK